MLQLSLWQLIRPLAGLLDELQGYLLHGFSVIHETLGPKLARLDKADPDAKNPAVYWRKHYAELWVERLQKSLSLPGFVLTIPIRRTS